MTQRFWSSYARQLCFRYQVGRVVRYSLRPHGLALFRTMEGARMVGVAFQPMEKRLVRQVGFEEVGVVAEAAQHRWQTGSVDAWTISWL